jgi:hypothetical protein
MRMSPPRTFRRAGRTAVAVATAAVLTLPLAASQAQGEQAQRIPGKKFAAYEYGWYPIHFVDHFEPGKRLSRKWDTHGVGSVHPQNGMLTIVSGGNADVGATLRREAHRYGRWEIRLRGKRFETGNTDFTVAAELIPAGDRSQNCGARNVGLASFRPHSGRARFFSRTLPNDSFHAKKRLNLRNDYWHTYGVELTRKRVSWFVDGEVRRTERRPEALSGVPMAFRLQLQAVPGATMNDSRLQVDTVRYFTLKSPNDKSIRAPRARKGSFRRAC